MKSEGVGWKYYGPITTDNPAVMPKVYWSTSDWSACSKTCAGGEILAAVCAFYKCAGGEILATVCAFYKCTGGEILAAVFFINVQEDMFNCRVLFL